MFGLFSPSSKSNATDSRTVAGDFSTILQGGSQFVQGGGGLLKTVLIVAIVGAVVLLALPLLKKYRSE